MAARIQIPVSLSARFERAMRKAALEFFIQETGMEPYVSESVQVGDGFEFQMRTMTTQPAVGLAVSGSAVRHGGEDG